MLKQVRGQVRFSQLPSPASGKPWVCFRVTDQSPAPMLLRGAALATVRGQRRCPDRVRTRIDRIRLLVVIK